MADIAPMKPKEGCLRRMLKVAGIVLLVLVVVGGIVRVVAGVVSQRHLNERLDALRANGEPVHLAEMAPPEVPPERNAAVLYEQAFAIMKMLPENTTRRMAELSEKKSPLQGADLEEGRVLVAQTADVLRLLREGAARPECRYPIRYDTEPTIATLLPELSHVRSGVRMLGLSFEVHLTDGRADAAAEDCLAAARLAKSARGEPFLISELVDIACNQLAQRQLEALLDRSELPAETLARFAPMPSEAETRKRFQHTMQSELCMGIDAFRHILSGRMDTWMLSDVKHPPLGGALLTALTWVFRPVLAGDFASYIDDMSLYVELAGRPYREAHAGWQTRADALVRNTGAHPYSRAISRLLLPALSRAAGVFEHGFECEQMAAIAVALRRYRMDCGQYPDALDALAPKYLAAVPADLFSGESLKYRKEGKGFLLYSVGLNGKDDGGVEPPKSSRDEGDIVWRSSR